MRWFLLSSALVVCSILGLLAAGAMLPVKHQVSGSLSLSKAPGFVWRLVSEPEQQSKWRSQVTSVERLPDRDGHPAWREHYKNGQKLAFETLASEPQHLLVRKIMDESAFGGEWEILLVPEKEGTQITVTERGEVYNPFFRFISRFVIGQEKTVNEYLADLKRACK